MAERLKAAVLKTADREVRGFESLSLRQPFSSGVLLILKELANTLEFSPVMEK